MACRACSGNNVQECLDLGLQPLANDLPLLTELSDSFTAPLRLGFCLDCSLMQLDHEVAPERIFSSYTYFSSTSSSWLSHAKAFAHRSIERFELDSRSCVIEIASNDGYLLQYFQAQGIQVLGIEPADTAASVAIAKGIPTLGFFLTRDSGQKLAPTSQADLLIANNVLAHVPDMDDFVGGLAALLKPKGTLVIEAPYAGNLISDLQFDTIYHEHYSYLLLGPVAEVLLRNGLEITDVEWLSTHGGSMRLFCRKPGLVRPSSNLEEALRREELSGLKSFHTYAGLQSRVEAFRHQLLAELSVMGEGGRHILGYSAPAKATTLLNYCGIGPERVAFTVDASPSKQGRMIPGVRIPIMETDELVKADPPIIWAFAWNLRSEIESWAKGQALRGRIFVTQPRIALSSRE